MSKSTLRNTRLRVIQEEYSKLATGQPDWAEFSSLSYAKDFNKERYEQIRKALDENLEQIDKLIAKYSKEREFKNLNPIDIAILRVIIAELFFAKLAGYKILINEAIEIAKKYSTANSYKYINGVLGAILRNEYKDLLKEI